MRLTIIALMLSVTGLLSQSGCHPTSVGGSVGSPGGGSRVTSVNIGLPDRGTLKSQVADIETRMNGYHLTITPADPTCAEPTKVDETADYGNSVALNASLKQGCDYDIVLELGRREVAAPGGTATPAGVTYQNRIQQLLATNCLTCHGVATRPPAMNSYDTAKAAGPGIIDHAVVTGKMPPAPNPALPQADKDALKQWADAGFPEKIDAGATTTGATAVASGLVAVFYKNEVALRIKREDIAGKPTYKASLSLQLQAGGRAIGLGAQAPSPGSETFVPPTPTATPSATPTPVITPSPEPTATPLP